MSGSIKNVSKILVRLRKIALTLISLGLLLQGGLSFADDTEIFFGKASSDIKPNIFFVLDDSGSMKGERLTTLKNTMKSLLNDMKNVNVGLMSMHFNGGVECGNKSSTWGCVRRLDNNKYYESGPPSVSVPVKPINTQVREDLKKVVENLSAGNNTPTSMSLYDAARYLTALQGKHNASAISPNDSKSPINQDCQPTHLVLLTDGEANMEVDVAAIEKLTGKTCAARKNSAERCASELADWLYTTNQSNLEKTFIKTHTIGFNLGSGGTEVEAYLDEIARKGRGVYRLANGADELKKAFDDILLEAADVKNTSFVNPSVAGGDFRAFGNKNQAYYSLFEPSTRVHWLGNLKRYGLRDNGGNNPPTVIDKDEAEAIDPVSGSFKDSAQSWWSKSKDGSDVTAGGAAANLPEPDKRNLLFSLNNSMQKLEYNNITNKMLGAKDNGERKQLLRYIRGFSNLANENDKKARYTLGDPLHSAPVVFSYACEKYDEANKKCMEPYGHENKTQVAVVGTNEGFVHMFDTSTGKELFAFMPEELLGNIKKLKENAGYTTAQTHIYGMDNTVTVWVNDANNNGKIDGGEKVYVYASMRRGGRGIYALDVTDKNNPKLKWKIVGGKSSGFEKLGQTWSKPIKTKVKIDGETKDVLIFGGGYDERQDADFNYRTQDQYGNDIYMVDAVSGEKLWSASSLNLDRMKYSIPATVRVLTDNDGLSTQFFVGDTGGQVWRFFVHNGETKSKLISTGGRDGIFFDAADGAPSGHASNSRRFYHQPDVKLDNGKLVVNIGSGYRAHPLDTQVKDRMYSIQTTLADNKMALKESDLVRVNDYFDGKAISKKIADGSKGWFIELQEAGEKIISTPLTERGRVIFNSYVPNVSTVKCAPAIGKNKIYDLHLLDATPVSMKLGDVFSYSEGSFFTLSKGQGISGSPELICLADRCWVQYSSGEFSDPFSTQVAGRKTYWIDLQ